MLCVQPLEFGSFDFAQFFLKREAGLFLEFTEKIANHDDGFTIGILANGVSEALVHRDAEVGGKGPGRGGPDGYA